MHTKDTSGIIYQYPEAMDWLCNVFSYVEPTLRRPPLLQSCPTRGLEDFPICAKEVLQFKDLPDLYLRAIPYPTPGEYNEDFDRD